MNYGQLFRALCALAIPYSWQLQVSTWMHEKPDSQPRCPATEWQVALLPPNVGCIFVTAATPEELLMRVQSYVETGSIGGRELLSAVGDCDVEVAP